MVFRGIGSVLGSAGPPAGGARLSLAKDGLCHLFLPLEIFSGRDEEARKQAMEQDRKGNSGRKVQSFQITQARTILPDLLEPRQ